MSAKWLPARVATFDTETTGVEPARDHIVSASLLYVGADGLESEEAWLINPGVPIPPEAVAIHGITDDIVRQSGVALVDGIPSIARALKEAWGAGVPVVAMNCSFDLSMLDHELYRCAHSYLTPGPVLDPILIDRAMDKYRKGSRKLDALAAHYGVKQGAAHNSREDALTAARVVWAQAKRYPAIQHLTLEEMQTWQREQHVKWAEGFERYRAAKGEPVTIDREWPMRAGEAA